MLLALHATSRRSGALSWDLLRGVADAWLHPTLRPKESSMSDPTARSLPRTAWGLLAFVMAAAGFAKVLEDPSFASAAGAHPGLAWSANAMRAAGLVIAATVAVAAVVALGALPRLTPSERRRCLLLQAVVPCSFATWLIVVAVARHVTDDTSVHSAAHVTAFVALVVASLMTGACSTAAVLRVAVALPLLGFGHRIRSLAIVIAALGTLVAAAAATMWTLVLALQSPHLLRADDGLLATPTVVSMLLVITSLTAAAVLCGLGAVDVLSSRAVAPRSSR